MMPLAASGALVPLWLVLVAAGGTVVAAIGMLIRAPAASPADSSQVKELRAGTIWHATSRRLRVGETVKFDTAFCPHRSRMFRTDRPLALPERAVWFFKVPPSEAHLSSNVGRRRRAYVYELRPITLNRTYERRDVIASTDPVEAVVCSVQAVAWP